jgi:hypothetical protein
MGPLAGGDLGRRAARRCRGARGSGGWGTGNEVGRSTLATPVEFSVFRCAVWPLEFFGFNLILFSHAFLVVEKLYSHKPTSQLQHKDALN